MRFRPADGFHGALGRGCITYVVDGDGSTSFGESQRDAAAYSTRAPRHQREFSSE
jgi:hypothetical protein